MTSLQLLLLIWIANGAPVLAHALLGTRFAYPVDGGARFLDGRPFFGTAKTLRGVIVAVLLTTLAAQGLGLPAGLGALVGSAAVAGDLLTSFIKRRMGLPPSSRARGLDQVPESLLPALLAAPRLDLEAGHIVLVVGLFVVLAVGLSPVLCRMRVRETPH
ncbi:MAG: CDP-archaeol synthase [Gammaproteobacteria bacterium]